MFVRVCAHRVFSHCIETEERSGFTENWASILPIRALPYKSRLNTFNSALQYNQVKKRIPESFGGTEMDKIYFTITGTSYRYGTELFEKGDRVMLKKEPDNKYDHEAIQAKVPGLGVIGYVANSVPTVLGESYSAGRLYDKIGDEAEGKVIRVLPEALLCVLCDEWENSK